MDTGSSDPSASSGLEMAASNGGPTSGSQSSSVGLIDDSGAEAPRSRKRVYIIGVCALVVIVGAAALGVVFLRGGTSSRDITLVVADTTRENRVPANARIILDSSAEWFPTWQNGRASQIYKSEVKPGATLLVAASVPSALHLRIQLPNKLPDGVLTALLTIGDASVTLGFDNMTVTAKRADPVAEARQAAQAAFVAEMKRVEAATKQVDTLSTQADAAYQAIFGSKNQAPEPAIVQGIDTNVAPKVAIGEAILAGVTSKDPRIADWLSARTMCWSLWDTELTEERNNAVDGQPSEDVVVAAATAYQAACNASAAKRKALETAAGIFVAGS